MALNLGEWLARAEREQSRNLHKFNLEREASYGCEHLKASHEAFEEYLALIDSGRDSRGADEILVEYQATLSHSPKGLTKTSKDYRYLPPDLNLSSGQVFLKHLGLDSTYLRRIGFKDAHIRDAEDKITALLRSGRTGRLEADLQKIAKGVLPRKVDPAAVLRAYRGSPSSHSFGGPPARTGFGTEPWWFTFESALKDEERRLPKPSRALEKSGYAAGIRAALGLDNPGDRHSDTDVASAGKIRFRILFQLVTRIPSKKNFPWRQPGLFSGGFPHLFVSNPRSHDGGRTVRLFDRSCATHPHCRCAADGLPEGVVPGYVVMNEAPSRKVRGIFLVLHRDLARYSAPSCDEIRDRRAA
jgi:hypothetical protein